MYTGVTDMVSRIMSTHHSEDFVSLCEDQLCGIWLTATPVRLNACHICFCKQDSLLHCDLLTVRKNVLMLLVLLR